MRYHLKLSDIVLSLFVEFCISLTILSIAGLIASQFIPYDVTIRFLTVLLCWTIAIPSLILAGAAWKRKVNKIGIIVIAIVGGFYLLAGLFDYFGPPSSVSIIGAIFIFLIGKEKSFSPWIDKIVIIKRNPVYDDVLEELLAENELDENEPPGELFD